MTRRQFLKLAGGAAGAYVVGRATYFSVWEAYDLRVTEWHVPLPRLPAALNGLRLAHLSDIHLCQSLPYDYLASAVELSGQLGATAVLLTGDILSAPPGLLEQFAEVFSRPKAPRGKYAVLGNHDFYHHRTESVCDFLAETGWQVLRNQSLPLPGTEEQVWLVGVDDPVTSRDDLPAALEGVPEPVVRVVLTHTPDLIEPAAAAGVDLMLAGHTHGGQVVLPFLGPPVVPSMYGSKYAWGLFDHGGTRMVVSRGVGMIPPRVRFNCPPEIGLLTLYRGDRTLPSGGPPRDYRPQVRRLRRQLSRLRRRLRK